MFARELLDLFTFAQRSSPNANPNVSCTSVALARRKKRDERCREADTESPRAIDDSQYTTSRS